MNIPATPIVFISHIHEEQAMGEVVKEWVEGVFEVSAWLSSDRNDLPSGRLWRNEILERLEQAAVLVSLISPRSLIRPWVNIELGAAWIKGTRVIPLCHSSQTFAALPPPFSDFQGFGLEQDDAAERLLGGVADGLGKKLRKKIAFADCLADLRGKQVLSQPPPEAAKVAQARLPAEQLQLLIMAAQAKNKGGDGHIQFDHLARGARISPAVATHHVAQLVKGRLLMEHWYSGGPFYSLTSDGSAWLIEHDQMPAVEPPTARFQTKIRD